MQWLMDFITLRFFVTPYLIVLAYWIGAFVVPLLAALITAWLANKAKNSDISATHIESLQKWINTLPYARATKWAIGAIFMLIFLFLELAWRILFEILIALFHIHDALLAIAKNT